MAATGEAVVVKDQKSPKGSLIHHLPWMVPAVTFVDVDGAFKALAMPSNVWHPSQRQSLQSFRLMQFGQRR